MINSWSMLYDVMNDLDWVSANGGFEYTPLPYNTPIKADDYSANIGIGTNYDWNDFCSSMEKDKIDLNLDSTSANGRWKYHEDVILKDIKEYVSGTYNSHYTSEEPGFKDIQTIDLMAAKGLASAFCQSNIIKYGSRYGDKDGKNKKDLLKVIHYAMLLLHFDDHYKVTKTDFPY